jgi:general secretion pathway protein G
VHAGRRQRGSGWFEFALAAVSLSALAGVLLHQLIEYPSLAERAVVDLTLRNMRSGLRWQVAERLLRGRAGDLASLEGANPVLMLARPPDGYAGEFGAREAAPRDPGTWYFDRERRQLAYLPRRAWHSATSSGLAEMRWQVRVLKSTAAPAVSAPVAGLVLVEAASVQ